jgi:hypothetical protein
MTIMRIVKRDMDREMYRALQARVNLGWDHPPGLILHGASEVSGSVQVTQVWDSAACARAFDEDRMRPALRAVGAPLDADVSLFELHDLITP